MTKKWYKSKTIWYNGLIFVGAVVSALLAFLGEPEVAGYVGTGAVAALVAVDKAINLVLRFVTSEALSEAL